MITSRVSYAKEHLKALKDTAARINILRKHRGPSAKQKVRIAVLDTGVNPKDDRINMSLATTKDRRIAERRSWVGRGQEDHGDTCGHGTHITRILTDLAPSAKIYIAKISQGLEVKQEDMVGIAKVRQACLLLRTSYLRASTECEKE